MSKLGFRRSIFLSSGQSTFDREHYLVLDDLIEHCFQIREEGLSVEFFENEADVGEDLDFLLHLLEEVLLYGFCSEHYKIGFPISVGWVVK